MTTRRILHTLASLLIVVIFSIFVFGQGSSPEKESETEFFVRVMGWILISGAAISHITTNIYSVVKGKNYEQLKEAATNWEKLADSRKAQMAEKDTKIAILERELEHRDLEDERRRETELRK